MLDDLSVLAYLVLNQLVFLLRLCQVQHAFCLGLQLSGAGGDHLGLRFHTAVARLFHGGHQLLLGRHGLLFRVTAQIRYVRYAQRFKISQLDFHAVEVGVLCEG